MALPKISHTQISNEFIENHMPHLNGGAVKLFLAIARKTIGWHKETDAICYEQLMELTGMSRQSVSNAVKELEERGLIKTVKAVKKTTVYEIDYEVVVQKVDQSGLKSRPPSGLKSRRTKETAKETIQKKPSATPSPMKDPDANSFQEMLTEEVPMEAWGSIPKERKNLNTLAANTRGLSIVTGVSSAELIPAIVTEYKKLKKMGKTDYWKSAPLTPSGILSRWDVVVEGLRKSHDKVRAYEQLGF
ncbi:MAG: replication protein [Wenzhouxiangella sp.]|nr:replication protein [Wenzhouxiangella sp.]